MRTMSKTLLGNFDFFLYESFYEIYFLMLKSALIYQKFNENDKTNEIFFEFYIVSANVTQNSEFSENRAGNIANLLDFENMWLVAMRVLMIFEDLLSSLPGNLK